MICKKTIGLPAYNHFSLGDSAKGGLNSDACSGEEKKDKMSQWKLTALRNAHPKERALTVKVR